MMKKYSKIGKLSTAVKSLIMQHQFEGLDEFENPIYNKNKELPLVELYGTIKLHGTNAGIMQKPDGELQFQSRENIITPEKDNAAFAFWANSKSAILTKLFSEIRKNHGINPSSSIVIYGEWAGKGIQKGVGISELAKAFYIFDIAIIPESGLEDNWYLRMDNIPSYFIEEHSIYNIWDKTRFPVYNITMDLNEPALIQNDIVSLTEEVEKECPVAKYFGIENGIGEGVVWRDKDRLFICKIKGDKHAGKSKVRSTNKVDLVKMNSVKEFVDEFADEERLEQAWQKMIELDFGHESKFTGDFVRWMINDIISEESDTLAESGLEPRDVNPAIGKVSSRWFLNKLDEI